jgi:hypothetical protein
MPMTGPTLPEPQQTQALVAQALVAQALVERIARLPPGSTADALRELRSAFPDIPLAERVMALDAMRRAGTSR